MYIFGGVIILGRINCPSKGRANCSEVLIRSVTNIEFISTDLTISYYPRTVV